jgi:hypothetical protein
MYYNQAFSMALSCAYYIEYDGVSARQSEEQPGLP